MSISRAADFVYAIRIITLLTTPWENHDAFKLGIIDAEGNVLIKYKDLRTSEQRDAYTYLHRIIFNVKRLIEKVPGGKTTLGKAVAALLLLKEGLSEFEFEDNTWKYLEERIMDYADSINEDTPTNVTGAAVSTDSPKPIGLARRKKKEEVKVESFGEWKNRKDSETSEKMSEAAKEKIEDKEPDINKLIASMDLVNKQLSAYAETHTVKDKIDPRLATMIKQFDDTKKAISKSSNGAWKAWAAKNNFVDNVDGFEAFYFYYGG